MKSKFNFNITRFKCLYLGLILGALAMLAIQHIPFSAKLSANVLPGNGQVICGLSEMPTSSTSNGMILTEQAFNDLTSAYKQANPESPTTTWGGKIGKNHLIAVINSLGSGADVVNFKFITNASNGKTSIIFKGGNLNAVTGDNAGSTLYMRTGTAADAFCPTQCN